MIALLAFAVTQKIHLEAEDAQQLGTHVEAFRPGYSGSGYSTGFTKDGDRLVWHVKGKVGIYSVHIRYSSPHAQKGFDFGVNGFKTSGMFSPTGDDFEVCAAGRVELTDGDNEVELDKGWGYYDVDSVDLVPTKVDSHLPKPPSKPCDPKATAEARKLFEFLRSKYGGKTLSGQYGAKDNQFVLSSAKVLPAIVGDDFIDYSPSRLAFGADPKHAVENQIANARKGQIVTMSWHWNAPDHLLNKHIKDAQGRDIDASWYKGFYTNATTFDLSEALDHPDSQDHKLILRDIDAIAVQLEKFQRAKVPVLWRPLHEAEGGWFWWGAKGPEPFKKLWKLMYRRLTVEHHLHNLIWVYSSGTNPDWYPGDEFVDIVGIDAYPSDQRDPLSSTWDELADRFKGKKLLAITEFGGVPDVERMHRFGVNWSYFVSWVGSIGSGSTDAERLSRLYKESRVLNANGLPKFTGE